MKITKLKTVTVKLPLKKPISSAIHSIRSVGCVLVYLETEKELVLHSVLIQ